jgi:hypothetical protein
VPMMKATLQARWVATAAKAALVGCPILTSHRAR